MDIEWTKASDRLPDFPGWYMVYAPSYRGGSSSKLDNHGGIMFSKFSANGRWSIEVGYYERPGCVKAWMPIPEKPHGIEAEPCENDCEQMVFDFGNVQLEKHT